jgi:hypothetical protein
MKGAHVDRLYSKQTGAMRVGSFVRDRIGPPFWPSEQMRSRFAHQITEQQNSISIKTWMQSKKYPGLQFTKTYVITGGSPILKIKRSLSNTKSSNTYNLGLQSTGWGQNMIHHPTIPLQDAIIQEKSVYGEFPASSREIPRKIEDWRETWFCSEFKTAGEVLGLLYHPDDVKEILVRNGVIPTFELKEMNLPPKTTVHLHPHYVVLGPGNWMHVRELWRQLIKDLPNPESTLPTSNPPLEITTHPSPLIIKSEKTLGVPIKVQHHLDRPVNGKLILIPPKGWKINPRSIKIKDLDRKHPFTHTLLLSSSSPPTPGVLLLKAQFRMQNHINEFTLPILLGWGIGEVEITESQEGPHKIHTIDNGLYRLAVSPTFGGTGITLQEKSTNYSIIKSNFPTASSMVWYNPWYGGIYLNPFPPGIDRDAESPIVQETFTSKITTKKTWKGVALTTRPHKKAKDLKGLQFTFSFLTQPKSNIFAIETTIKNLTTARIRITNRVNIGLLPGGSMTGLETWVPGEDRFYKRSRGPTHAFLQTPKHYAGLFNKNRKESYLYITTPNRNGGMLLEDMPPDLIMFSAHNPVELPPKGSITIPSYFVIAKSPMEKAKYYSNLV